MDSNLKNESQKKCTGMEDCWFRFNVGWTYSEFQKVNRTGHTPIRDLKPRFSRWPPEASGPRTILELRSVCSVAKSCLTLRHHGLQYIRLLCPSLSPGACSDSWHWVSDAIQPSHPLSSPSPPAFNLSQHQGLFQWVSSSHQVAKELELQHPSFHWIFRVDFL